MNLLAIDTSTKNFSIAILRDAEVLVSENTILEKILSDSIIPSIQRILKKAKLGLADIDGFAVGLGPGSFTSLRVGLATIKGLAFSLDKPVVGIPSPDAIAMNIREDHPKVCVISDARRNLVYASWYEKKGGRLKPKSDYKLTSITDLLQGEKGEIVFIGDAIQLFKKEIAKFKLKPIFIDEKLWYPKAQNLGLLALPRFQKGKVDEVDTLVPLYLYPEDCQVQNKG